MNKTETIAALQTTLKAAGHYKGEIDGMWGPKSQHALDELLSDNPDDPSLQMVWASSFADPADIRAFKRCKAQGKSDQECFKVGDNGIGAWGDNTAGDTNGVALPPETLAEKWGNWKAGHNKAVTIKANGRIVSAKVLDRMPYRKNIKNGCSIDLNYATCKDLGLESPVKIKVQWSWDQ